jgi:ribose transport system permease protein
MSGGKGRLLGVLFGAMSYTIIDKIIASLGVDALINDTIKGTILLLAVFIQIMLPLLRSRAKSK